MKRFQTTYILSILFVLSLVLSACGGATPEPAAQVQEQAEESNVEQQAGSMENMAGMGSNDIPPDLDLNTERLTDQGLFQARITSNLDPVDINEIHSWTLRLETPEGEAIEGADIAVDGGMPQHNHGFPTSPAVTGELGNGDYLVEGVRFNMTGWWEMKFEITANGQSDQITFNLVVETGHDEGAMEEMDHAHDDHAAHGELVVEHIVANLTLPTDTGAVYGTIINGTAQDEALVAAAVEGCDTIEFHQSTMTDDVMKMAPVEGGQIPIPAGETVNMESGGLHLMCIGKTKTFAAGEQVPVTFTFAHAGQVEGSAEVREPGDMAMDHDGHADHSDHSDQSMHTHDKIPNDGAIIRIVSPAAGAEIEAGDMVPVKVETEGFDLAAEGNHWHLYVDDDLVEMVEGTRSETIIHYLEAGQHTIMTTMADADHNEYEEGAMLTITVK